MSAIEAIILGLLQGLTEFLPVSSSGHLELAKAIFGNAPEEGLTFTIVVHFATVLSTIVVFHKDIWHLLKALFSFRWNEDTQFISKIFLSMIPIGIVGLLWEDEIEAFFNGNVVLVGFMLLLTALVLFLTTFAKANTKSVSFGSALIIGLAQAVAVMPGISRSGSTIGVALLLGVEKDRATRFSFLMVLLPIIGATILKAKDLLEEPGDHSAEVQPLLLGFGAAFISGWFACRWMIRIVRRGKIAWFALYCALAGATAIAIGLLY